MKVRLNEDRCTFLHDLSEFKGIGIMPYRSVDDLGSHVMGSSSDLWHFLVERFLSLADVSRQRVRPPAEVCHSDRAEEV